MLGTKNVKNNTGKVELKHHKFSRMVETSLWTLICQLCMLKI